MKHVFDGPISKVDMAEERILWEDGVNRSTESLFATAQRCKQLKRLTDKWVNKLWCALQGCTLPVAGVWIEGNLVEAFFFLSRLFSFFFNFILFLTLQYCISFAKYRNESATGIHEPPPPPPPPPPGGATGRRWSVGCCVDAWARGGPGVCICVCCFEMGGGLGKE